MQMIVSSLVIICGLFFCRMKCEGPVVQNEAAPSPCNEENAQYFPVDVSYSDTAVSGK